MRRFSKIQVRNLYYQRATTFFDYFSSEYISWKAGDEEGILLSSNPGRVEVRPVIKAPEHKHICLASHT